MSDFIPLVKYDKCSFCGSKNFDRRDVKTDITMAGDEKTNPFTGTIDQIISYVTDAYICGDCGHVDFFNFGQDRDEK